MPALLSSRDDLPNLDRVLGNRLTLPRPPGRPSTDAPSIWWTSNKPAALQPPTSASGRCGVFRFRQWNGSTPEAVFPSPIEAASGSRNTSTSLRGNRSRCCGTTSFRSPLNRRSARATASPNPRPMHRLVAVDCSSVLPACKGPENSTEVVQNGQKLLRAVWHSLDRHLVLWGYPRISTVQIHRFRKRSDYFFNVCLLRFSKTHQSVFYWTRDTGECFRQRMAQEELVWFFIGLFSFRPLFRLVRHPVNRCAPYVVCIRPETLKVQFCSMV